MAGAVQGTIGSRIVYVVVASQRCVRRPLVSNKGDKSAGVVLGVCLLSDFCPDRFGDLEVVPLMSGEVNQCCLPCKAKIGGDWIGANGFFALTVEVAPEGLVCAPFLYAAEWVPFRCQPILCVCCLYPINPSLGCFHAFKAVDTTVCGLELIGLWQARQSVRR